MRTAVVFVLAFVAWSAALLAQETKAIPKDSVRVTIPGCTKGYVFTAGRRTVEQPGSASIPEGMHLRMNGQKKMMAEIKAHEGSMIEIIGLMKKGQFDPGGIDLGGGVRVSGGSVPASGSLSASPNVGQILIDVEGWRPALGACSSR